MITLLADVGVHVCGRFEEQPAGAFSQDIEDRPPPVRLLMHEANGHLDWLAGRQIGSAHFDLPARLHRRIDLSRSAQDGVPFNQNCTARQCRGKVRWGRSKYARSLTLTGSVASLAALAGRVSIASHLFVRGGCGQLCQRCTLGYAQRWQKLGRGTARMRRPLGGIPGRHAPALLAQRRIARHGSALRCEVTADGMPAPATRAWAWHL